MSAYQYPSQRSKKFTTIRSKGSTPLISPSSSELKGEKEFIFSRAHNASAYIGPGYYNLPSISNNRSVSFSQKFNKKQYCVEYCNEFRGIDSPALTRYSPNHLLLKDSSPGYSISRQKRKLSAIRSSMYEPYRQTKAKFIEGPYFGKSQSNFMIKNSSKGKLHPTIGKQKRIIDLSKWKGENCILIQKGLGL